MAYYLSYKINGIDGQFVMPISQFDDVKYVTSRVKKEFGIIPELKAKIYGSDLQSTNIVSRCVRSQDVITFDIKEVNGKKPKLEFYRTPIIVPRYQSKITEGSNLRTFIVYSTVNFQSMTSGNKLKIDIEKDNLSDIQNKIKNMLSNQYKTNIDSNKILVFLPGGIPFFKSNISQFIKSFPLYMPHLYAILVTNENITDAVLEKTYDKICNIKDPQIRTLLSPDINRETSGLCEIASVLGYIQQNAPNVRRMIYSISKYCQFAPMICGLYHLACLSRVTGRTILQITAPMILLFKEMGKTLKIEDSKLFSSTVNFLTFFMNIRISARIPCTEFIRPFYSIGYEKYFSENYDEMKIDSIIAYDPDFRDEDHIRFALPQLTGQDFADAFSHTSTLAIIPPMSLREMHRVSLFKGLNGPWLFLAASISKDETDRDKIDYIDPENGEIEHDTYENIAVKVIGVDYKTHGELFDRKVIETIDAKKVTQLVEICIDKSGSMILPLTNVEEALRLYRQRKLIYGTYEDRFTISQKFFTKFIEACYKYHTSSLYGSIMFNHEHEVRNELNPLANNFVERMIHKGEVPQGGTRMFTAIKTAADKMLEANKDNKFTDAVMRIIVISDGNDEHCTKQEMTDVMNFLLQKKIRVDGIIVSDDIARELVAISRFTGGISIFPRTLEEGLDFFNKEEFFNVNLRQFGEFRQREVTLDEVKGLPPVTVDQLDSEIKIRQNEFADKDVHVTSPSYAITQFEKEVLALMEGHADAPSHFSHPATKRIISELKKIITEPDEDFRVYPLKDRVDVWRVLIKGFEGSLYASKWFYMIAEFNSEYPAQAPMFRFMFPPFHPNITDQGRICLDTLENNYRSDMSVRELIGQIRYLLLNYNFDSCVDLKREKYKDRQPDFAREVNAWNDRNGKDTAEKWEEAWQIEEDNQSVIDYTKNIRSSIAPEQFLCPITRDIMKEPVKASSGVYYEKVALEKYLNSTENPVCRAKNDENGKPLPLPRDLNMNLKIDNEMKTKINNWIKENNYLEDEEEGNDDENILDFRKKKIVIEKPAYPKDLIDGPAKLNEMPTADDDFSSSHIPPRVRPFLSEA